MSGSLPAPLGRLRGPSACTLAGMSWLRRIWLLMLVLGTLLSPRLASAQAPLGLDIRVGGLDLAAEVIVGVHGLASPGSYLGNPDGYDENASGCSLAAGGAASRIVPGGGLAAHEGAGGHLLARHVGKAEADLAARLTAEPRLRAASTKVELRTRQHRGDSSNPGPRKALSERLDCGSEPD